MLPGETPLSRRGARCQAILDVAGFATLVLLLLAAAPSRAQGVSGSRDWSSVLSTNASASPPPADRCPDGSSIDVWKEVAKVGAATVLFVFSVKEGHPVVVKAAEGVAAFTELMDLYSAQQKAGERQVCLAAQAGSASFPGKKVYYAGPAALTTAIAARDAQSLQNARTSAPSHGMATLDSPELKEALRQMRELHDWERVAVDTQSRPAADPLSPPDSTHPQGSRLLDSYSAPVALPHFDPSQFQQIRITSILSGVVRNSGPRSFGVQNAVVVLRQPELRTSQEVVTDAAGRYSFNGLPAGQYVLSVGKPGFIEQRANVSLERGTTREVDLVLPRDAYPCTFTVSNRTHWHIDATLMEGLLQRELPRLDPYRDVELPEITHEQTLFARATFSDHAPLDWGPIKVSCTGSASASLLPPAS